MYNIFGFEHPETSPVWVVQRSLSYVFVSLKGNAASQGERYGPAFRPVCVQAGNWHDQFVPVGQYCVDLLPHLVQWLAEK
jgi:hypothetical protein